MFKREIPVVAAFMLLLLAVLAISAYPFSRQERVLFQVYSDDPRQWEQTLASIKNLDTALRGKVEIQVVAFGSGVQFLTRTNSASPRLQELSDGGVALYACQNSMLKREMTQAMMLPSVQIVEAGIVEVLKKERAGWLVWP